jgi:hypothetical protein
MSNAQSKAGMLIFDGAGGFDGPFKVNSIIVDTAGTYTFRASNSASGEYLLIVVNAAAQSLQIDMHGQGVSGIYMNTGFPSGGKAYVLVG